MTCKECERCKECLSYEVCQAWVIHGKALYDDFSYSIEACDHFKPKSRFVELRNGKWVYEGKPIHCNRCGFEPNYSLTTENSVFCPHCGAKMNDEEAENALKEREKE